MSLIRDNFVLVDKLVGFVFTKCELARVTKIRVNVIVIQKIH
jgi:hypothetical protein